MKFLNKKGEEFAEAAIVLPLTVLIILSLITAALFLFGHEVRQSKAHAALGREVAASKTIFGISRKSVSSSGSIRGLVGRNITKTGSFRAYVISQADAVLLGELAS